MKSNNILLLTLILGLASVLAITARPHPAQISGDDLVVHSVKFVGVDENQFLVIDPNGIHPHPFLAGDIIFVDQPIDGDTLTIGSVVFTFRDAASGPDDVQIASNLSATIDNLRDKITDAHIVHRSTRQSDRMTIFIADTVAIDFSATGGDSRIVLRGFYSCGE